MDGISFLLASIAIGCFGFLAAVLVGLLIDLVIPARRPRARRILRRPLGRTEVTPRPPPTDPADQLERARRDELNRLGERNGRT